MAPALVGLLALGLLGACTETMESLNPARLFEAGSAEPPPPGADQEFPNLASVPETPRKSSSPAEIAAIRDGLIADRERARYTDQELRNSATDEVNFAESTQATPGARRPLSAQGDAAEAEDLAAARAAQARLDALAASGATTASETPSVAKHEEAPATQAALDTPTNALLRFEPGSTELSNDAIERLVQLVGRFGDVGGALRVIGHAAPSAGDAAGGQTLAYDRALVVAAELKRLGVPAERMRVIAGDAGESVTDDRVDVVIEP